jgi:hypothetical protein
MTIERERGASMRPESGNPVVVPGFADAALRLCATPSVLAVQPPIAPPPRSRRGLLVMLSLLTVVFLGLATYAVTHPLSPIVIANATTDAKLSTPRTEPTIPMGSQAMWARDDVEIASVPSLTPVEPRDSATPRVRRVERAPRVDGITTPPPPRNADVPIECVLDPHLPKCAAKATTQPPVKGPAKADANLPDILSQTALRAGVAPVKAAAKACGTKHGAKPGEKVRVKLSVAGPTGAVVSTSPEPPHRGTPLGNCAAAALKKASFDKFRKPVIGLIYSITM